MKDFFLSARRIHLMHPFLLALSMSSLITVACRRGDDPHFLGSAHIEIDHFTLAPSVAGPLVEVTKQEGDSVQAGEVLARLDTMPLHWQREQLLAGNVELQASLRAKSREVAAIHTEASGVERDLHRIGPLVKSGSAPEQQEDKLRTTLSSARDRQRAAQAGAEGLKGREAALRAQWNALEDQMRRCEIRSPIAGKVITRYRGVGEMASPGQPVYEISRQDTVRADFYVPETMIAELSLGKILFIRLDTPDGRGLYEKAHIRAISDEAEFAPKNTQTRESRNELVFQIRALASNASGRMKRGMPVEIWQDTTAQP